MSPIQQIILLVIWIGVILVVLRNLNRAKTAEAASRTLLADVPDATHWNARSVGLKIVGSALATVAVTGIAFLWGRPSRGGVRGRWTPGLVVGSLVFAAVSGALGGYCLALRDLVQERRLRGQHVPLVLRAYFSSGVVSLILWIITGFAAGIGGIVFYYAFLSPGVGPAG